MVETIPNQDSSQSLTWEDVLAVCKLMGEDAVYCSPCEAGGNEYAVCRFGGFVTVFTDPAAALEFISAEEHPIEKKYANILRTKP
jgi:hypothetical protein